MLYEIKSQLHSNASKKIKDSNYKRTVSLKHFQTKNERSWKQWIEYITEGIHSINHVGIV